MHWCISYSSKKVASAPTYSRYGLSQVQVNGQKDIEVTVKFTDSAHLEKLAVIYS